MPRVHACMVGYLPELDLLRLLRTGRQKQKTKGETKQTQDTQIVRGELSGNLAPKSQRKSWEPLALRGREGRQAATK